MLITGVSTPPPVTTGHVNSDAPRITEVTVTEQRPAASPGQLKSAVDIINHAMQQSHQNLEFSVDSSTKTPVVKMTDSTTGQVISQFPSEAALAIAHSIDQMQPGLLLKQKA